MLNKINLDYLKQFENVLGNVKNPREVKAFLDGFYCELAHSQPGEISDNMLEAAAGLFKRKGLESHARKLLKQKYTRPYTFKSDSSLKIDIPKKVYKDTADLFYLLTGKGKQEAGSYLKHPSPDAALINLNALNMGAGLVCTSLMIGSEPIGQDVIWLAMARGKMVWNLKEASLICPSNFASYVRKQEFKVGIADLDAAIADVERKAQKVYNLEVMPYARKPWHDLGTRIEGYNPFSFYDQFSEANI